MALLLVMLATRLVSLGTLPDTLNPDEADNLQGAVRVVYGSPPDNGFFGFDWYGEPAFTAYVFALFIKLFGVSQFAARLPTVLASVASLGLLYVLLRRQVSVLAALLATLLFGSQLWYVHLSRMAWNNLHVTLFTLAAMLLLLHALEATQKRHAWTLFTLCGVYCALTLYSYPAGRVVLPSLFAVLPLAILRNKPMWKRILGGYVAIGSIAVVLFVPEAMYISTHWDGFIIRLSVVSILNKPAFQASPLGVLGHQLEVNFLGLWVGQFNNIPSHFPPGEPILDRVTGLLVAGGIIASLALRRFRTRFDTWLWWSIFLVGWFVTEVITDNTPDAARGTGWIPALLFFGALSLELGLGWAARLPVSGRAAVFGVVSVGAIAISGADVAHYVDWSGRAETRQYRTPFVSVAEFPAWSAAVIQDAEQHRAGFNVGFWRSQHPLDANNAPLPAVSQPTTGPAVPVVAVQPVTPRADWPTVLLTLGADGPGRLSQPRAVGLDGTHNIYVVDADPQEQAIKKFDPRGVFELSWGPPGAGDGEFTGAWAIVVDAQDHVLVLDQETGWVQVFDTSGRFLRKWSGPSIALYHPRAMALSANGDVYIADTGGGRVVSFSADGAWKAEYGNAAQVSEGERLAQPAGVIPLPDGSLVVADAPRGVVRKYGPSGAQVATWGLAQLPALDGPRLAPGPNGSVYGTLPNACAIAHLSASGELLDTVGNCQSRDYLDFPSAIALDPAGKLYVADFTRHVVEVLGPR